MTFLSAMRHAFGLSIPRPEGRAARELAKARMELLTGLDSLDHARASVSFARAKITRLEAFLSASAERDYPEHQQPVSPPAGYTDRTAVNFLAQR